jgi:hypothetical protein
MLSLSPHRRGLRLPNEAKYGKEEGEGGITRCIDWIIRERSAQLALRRL